MSIELKGRGYVNLHESSWNAVRKNARELGWNPGEVKAPADEGRNWPGYEYKVPEHNTRSLARALYRAIHMIEADTLSEPLVELVKEAGVQNLRAVGDLAYSGGFYTTRRSGEKAMREDRMTKEEFLASREAAGLRIDPHSADVEVTFWWAQVLDPYGVQDLTPEENCVGRSYFACSPDSGGWVSFYDLPDQTRDELWRRIDSGELVDSFEKRFLDGWMEP